MITFIIFTYNEAARIERVIKNFNQHGKILLADNNSTDGTQEIAKKLGCEVFIRKEDYAFVENQKLVEELYDVVTTEWIYWGFADEMLEQKTLLEIAKIVKSASYDLITMDRKNYFYGNFCYNLYHARTYKIFRKNALDFTNNYIHGMGKPTVDKSRIYDLPDAFFIHHFISNTASSYLNVINRYTESELLFDYKFKLSFFDLLLFLSKVLLQDFVRSKGFKSGFSSLALSQLMIFYALVKNMKLYEQKNALSNSSIEVLNNKHRDKILMV